jgi:hypothetical protein
MLRLHCVLRVPPNSFSAVSFWPLLLPRSRCRELLLHLTHTHTRSRIPLDEGSAPLQRPLHVQDTTCTSDRHPYSGGIRTRNPSKRAAEDPCVRPRGHWDRLPLTWTRSLSFKEKYNFETLHYVIISILPCVPLLRRVCCFISLFSDTAKIVNDLPSVAYNAKSELYNVTYVPREEKWTSWN